MWTEPLAERHLQAMLSYLLVYRNPVSESIFYAGQRFAESVNAFYGAEAFSVSDGPRGFFRIGCQCGWRLSVVFPADLAFDADAAPLAECLRRMVTHYEIRHNGLKGTGSLR
jgi:hypothetical protein